MLSDRFGTVNDFHNHKAVLSYRKPKYFLNIFGEEKELTMHVPTPNR